MEKKEKPLDLTELAHCPIDGYALLSDEDAATFSCPKRHFSISQPKGFVVSESDGKAIQEVLRRFRNELLEQRRQAMSGLFADEEAVTHEFDKDIGWVERLADLFGEEGK